MAKTSELLTSYLIQTLVPNNQRIVEAFTTAEGFDQKAFNHLGDLLKENRPITFNDLTSYDSRQQNFNLTNAISKLLNVKDVEERIKAGEPLTENQIKLLRSYVRSRAIFRQLNKRLKTSIENLPILAKDLKLSKPQKENLYKYLGKELDSSLTLEQIIKLNEDLTNDNQFMEAFQAKNGNLQENFGKGMDFLLNDQNHRVEFLELMGLKDWKTLGELLGAKDRFQKKKRQLTETEIEKLKALWDTHQKLDKIKLAPPQRGALHRLLKGKLRYLNRLVNEYSYNQLRIARIREHGIPESHVETLENLIKLRERFEEFAKYNNIDPINELEKLLEEGNGKKLEIIGIDSSQESINRFQSLIEQYRSIQDQLPDISKHREILGALQKEDPTLTPEEAKSFGIEKPEELNEALTTWQNETELIKKRNFIRDPNFKDAIEKHLMSDFLDAIKKTIRQQKRSNQTLQEQDADQTYNGPDQTYNSPDQTYNSPDQTYNSPDQTYNSPRADELSPDQIRHTIYDSFLRSKYHDDLYTQFSAHNLRQWWNQRKILKSEQRLKAKLFDLELELQKAEAENAPLNAEEIQKEIEEAVYSHEKKTKNAKQNLTPMVSQALKKQILEYMGEATPEDQKSFVQHLERNYPSDQRKQGNFLTRILRDLSRQYESESPQRNAAQIMINYNDPVELNYILNTEAALVLLRGQKATEHTR